MICLFYPPSVTARVPFFVKNKNSLKPKLFNFKQTFKSSSKRHSLSRNASNIVRCVDGPSSDCPREMDHASSEYADTFAGTENIFAGTESTFPGTVWLGWDHRQAGDVRFSTLRIAAAEKALSSFAQQETCLRIEQDSAEACCRDVQELQSFESVQARYDAMAALSVSRFLEGRDEDAPSQEVHPPPAMVSCLHINAPKNAVFQNFNADVFSIQLDTDRILQVESRANTPLRVKRAFPGPSREERWPQKMKADFGKVSSFQVYKTFFGTQGASDSPPDDDED